MQYYSQQIERIVLFFKMKTIVASICLGVSYERSYSYIEQTSSYTMTHFVETIFYCVEGFGVVRT